MKCPYCSEELSTPFSVDGDEAVPEPNNFAFCHLCGEFSRYDDPPQLRKLTDDEVVEAHFDEFLSSIRRMWLAQRTPSDRVKTMRNIQNQIVSLITHNVSEVLAVADDATDYVTLMCQLMAATLHRMVQPIMKSKDSETLQLLGEINTVVFKQLHDNAVEHENGRKEKT